MLKRFVTLLLGLLLFTTAAAQRPFDAGEIAQGILQFKEEQGGENWLPDVMGQGGEWYALALSQQGGDDLSACRAALDEYVKSTKVRSATTRQKLALTFIALGDRENAFVTTTLADAIGRQGVMSWAWGLHLLNNGCSSAEYTAEDIIATLLSLRKADGGWAVTGDVSDVDATAMVLQSLAPHKDKAEVSAAIDGAVQLLYSRQLDSGGYASYGVENAESCAQVIIALCALGTEPNAALLDALLAFRLADGSFAHEAGGAYSESATAQAFTALTAYQRFQAGEGSLYLLDGDAPVEMKTAWGYRPIAAAIIGGAAMVCCIVLLVMGKRHPKNFLAVALIAAALIVAVFFVDIQTADSYYTTAVTKKDAAGSVTLTIRCDKVAGQVGHIPANGVILPETTMPIAEGDTVYTVLTDAARAHGFHMEGSGANGLMYIHGIGNIYEFDFGDLSGWVYMVNGESASVGCDQYVLQDGDQVEWHYTLELGKDID